MSGSANNYLSRTNTGRQDQRTSKAFNSQRETLQVSSQTQQPRRASDSTGKTSQHGTKIDPSYKSKRYRDKLRCEIKELEALLPVDRSTLHRKLDSQTVFRLVIAFFRTKMFLKAAGLASQQVQASGVRHVNSSTSSLDDMSHDLSTDLPRDVPPDLPQLSDILRGNSLLQILDGFLLVLTADGTILYVSRNITQSLGFNQVDLMHRCIYGIVHPDDHHELKVALEHSLHENNLATNKQQRQCCRQQDARSSTCRTVSFLIRIKCFNGTTTGYLKMHCSGHMRHLVGTVKNSTRTSSHVLFALCRPFISTLTSDPETEARNAGFWSKHDLDLAFKYIDPKAADVLGCGIEELEGKSFYAMIHPEDLAVFTACHKTLIRTEEVQTMYFRVEKADGSWLWLHTRGKVVFKNSKKYSIVFTHCPVREEDSTYIQQEIVLRQRYVFRDLIQIQQEPTMVQQQLHYPHLALSYMNQDNSVTSQQASHCPSSWHSQTECHSPVFPAPNMPYKLPPREGPERKRQHSDNDNSASYKSSCMYDQSWDPSYVQYNEYPMYGYTDNMYPYRQNVPMTRQYLMHLNGLGLSQQMSPTTLVFQGQLTAIQTTDNPFFTTNWSHYTPQSYQPDTCCQTVTPNPSCQYANQPLDKHQEKTIDVSSNTDIKPDMIAPCKTNVTSNTCAVNSLPSCIYQSSSCRVACKLVDLNRYASQCMMEVTPSDKKGNIELPAIGSFLEYLNDLA